MHLFKSEFSFAWLSFLLAESFFWRENFVLSLCLWIFSNQIKARTFYVRAFSTCTICYFPSRKKLPCKWFVWLSEVSLKPVLEAEQFYLLDLGWRRVRGCPKDVPTSAVTVQRETSGFRFLVPALSPAPPFWNKHQEDLPPQLCCCQAFHWYFLMKTGDRLWIYTLGI